MLILISLCEWEGLTRLKGRKKEKKDGPRMISFTRVLLIKSLGKEVMVSHVIIKVASPFIKTEWVSEEAHILSKWDSDPIQSFLPIFFSWKKKTAIFTVLNTIFFTLTLCVWVNKMYWQFWKPSYVHRIHGYKRRPCEQIWPQTKAMHWHTLTNRQQ